MLFLAAWLQSECEVAITVETPGYIDWICFFFFFMFALNKQYIASIRYTSASLPIYKVVLYYHFGNEQGPFPAVDSPS